jgi:hypothetical protein
MSIRRIWPAAVGEDGGANLTEAHPVAPAGTLENEARCVIANHEGRAVEVRRGKDSTNLEFLSHGQESLRPADLEFDDPAGTAAPDRDDSLDPPHVDARLLLHPVRELVGGRLHPPSKKIARLEVEPGKDAGQETGVSGVAIGGRPGIGDPGIVHFRRRPLAVEDRNQVRNHAFIPCGRISLSHPAATFREPRVADLLA